MNSIEALENISITFDEGGYEPTTLGAKSGHFKEVFRVEFNIIEQDLKRLRQKQLEEKNKELNEKLKQAVDILKDKRIQTRFLEESKNVDEYNKWVSNLMNIRELTQEEYELLKEVLGNE